MRIFLKCFLEVAIIQSDHNNIFIMSHSYSVSDHAAHAKCFRIYSMIVQFSERVNTSSKYSFFAIRPA